MRKNARQKRALRRTGYVDASDQRRVERLIPK